MIFLLFIMALGFYDGLELSSKISKILYWLIIVIIFVFIATMFDTKHGG